MKTPFRMLPWTRLAALVALLTTTAALPTAANATTITTTETLEPIPTMIVASDDPTGYPDPICSKCTIIVVDDEESASTQASVHITYPVDAPHFAGAISVTLLLASGERRSLWLSHVSLEPGAEVELVAEADADWSWDDVRFVWLRFLAS